MTKGYYYDKRRDNYVVRATVDGKRVYLGAYHNEELAKEAYEAYTTLGTIPVVTVPSEFLETPRTPLVVHPVWWTKLIASIRRKKHERALDKELAKQIARL